MYTHEQAMRMVAIAFERAAAIVAEEVAFAPDAHIVQLTGVRINTRLLENARIARTITEEELA